MALELLSRSMSAGRSAVKLTSGIGRAIASNSPKPRGLPQPRRLNLFPLYISNPVSSGINNCQECTGISYRGRHTFFQTSIRSMMASTSAEGPPSSPPSTTPQDVLSFWFSGVDMENNVYPFDLWFGGGQDVDEKIGRDFGAAIEAAEAGDLDSWVDDPKGRLAIIILLDQFTRNVFRDTPRSFASDETAQALSMDAITKDMDGELSALERVYLYMPLMHSEDLKIHDASEAAFSGLCEEFAHDEGMVKLLTIFLGFEKRHREVIERFGRYPTRNHILGRSNTPEEEEYLAEIRAGKPAF